MLSNTEFDFGFGLTDEELIYFQSNPGSVWGVDPDIDPNPEKFPEW